MKLNIICDNESKIKFSEHPKKEKKYLFSK